MFFVDYDLDGRLDIFAANGHIEEQIGKVQPKVKYEEPPLMFRNPGKGKYEHVSASLGPAFASRRSPEGRRTRTTTTTGISDILVANNQGPARLLRNDGGNANRWLSVKAVGTKSNRSGIGAIVRLQTASGKQWSYVRSGGSYASQSDLALTFGLGQDPSRADARRRVAERREGSRDQRRRQPVHHGGGGQGAGQAPGGPRDRGRARPRSEDEVAADANVEQGFSRGACEQGLACRGNVEQGFSPAARLTASAQD